MNINGFKSLLNEFSNLGADSTNSQTYTTNSTTTSSGSQTYTTNSTTTSSGPTQILIDRLTNPQDQASSDGKLKAFLSIAKKIYDFMDNHSLEIISEIDQEKIQSAIKGLKSIKSTDISEDEEKVIGLYSQIFKCIAHRLENLVKQKKGLEEPFIEASESGKEDVRSTLIGKDISTKTITISGTYGNSLAVNEQFYKDFSRGDYYLEGDLLMDLKQRKEPYYQFATCTLLADQLGEQTFANLTRLMNQATLADLTQTIINLVGPERMLMGGSCLAYDVKIKDQEVELSIYVDFKVTDKQGEACGPGYPKYIAAKRVITISKEDLAKNWEQNANSVLSSFFQSIVAPSVKVEDRISGVYGPYKSAYELLK